MRRTGRAAPSLTAQLQETQAAEREAIETVIQQEQSKLVRGFRASSTVALSSIEKDISTHLKTIQREIRTRVREMDAELSEIRDRPRRIILISALTTAVVTAIFSTAPTLWTMWRMGGAEIVTDQTGTYLILPATAQTGWTCRGAPCIKLKE